MPLCERCGSETGPDRICPTCDGEAFAEAEAEDREFLAYEGDEYFVSGFVEAGLSAEAAKAEARNSKFVALCISFSGLEYVLKDHWATRGLLDAVLARDRLILDALADYARRSRAPKKRGPKPDPKTGKTKQEVAVELRLKGKSLREASRAMYNDPNQGHRVAALLSRSRKKRVPETRSGVPVVIPGPKPNRSS